MFWLIILLIVGGSFAADCAIEYISITYYCTGSDYVRKFMRKYIGYGWNDLEAEVDVTDEDVKAIRKFMIPIQDRFNR